MPAFLGPRELEALHHSHTSVDDRGIQIAVDAGNEHVTLTPEEMATFDEALAPVVDAWVAEHTEFDARALVDAARENLATFSS